MTITEAHRLLEKQGISPPINNSEFVLSVAELIKDLQEKVAFLEDDVEYLRGELELTQDELQRLSLD